MRRSAYIGDKPGQAGGLSVQTETSSYLAAMTTPPSTAWRTAVNLAIYEWKQQGNWVNLKGLWLLCAESAQAAALSVIGDTPRNMTVAGAPTFTASKGYSGFDGTTNQLTFPITSAILGDDDFTVFAAWQLDCRTTAGARMVIENATDATIASAGNANVAAGGTPTLTPSVGFMAANAFNAVESIVVGARDGSYIQPGSAANSTPSAATRGSNYKTANVAAASHPLVRLSTYGFLGSASTPRMAKSFMITLAKLIDTLGALD